MPYTTCFWLRTLITQRSCVLLGLPVQGQSRSRAWPSWQSWICVSSLSRLLCSSGEAVSLQGLFALWIKKPQPALPCVNTHSGSRLLHDLPACRSPEQGVYGLASHEHYLTNLSHSEEYMSLDRRDARPLITSVWLAVVAKSCSSYLQAEMID